MLKNLIKIASDLDAAGFKKEADIVDLIIRKVSSESPDLSFEDEGESQPINELNLSDEDYQRILDQIAEEEGDEAPTREDIEDRFNLG
jgi:hypothetical protein